MLVSIIGPKQTVLQTVSKKVSLPGDEGEMCVLDFHQPFLVKLAQGVIRISENKTAKLATKRIPIKDGLALMRGNELTILMEE